MLFRVTQTHSPESSPKDEVGSKILCNASARGVKLRALYGAFAEQTIYYVVEAHEIAVLQQLLIPGFKRCKCRITPVSEEAAH
jgi:hypothetical protein